MNQTPPLVDDEARRQAAEDLERSLFVEAAAGAGKTTVMVARVANLVRAGRAEIGRIAAITFTEAAAAELKTRVAEKLRAALDDADAEEGDRLRRALENIDDAPIGTIHSFCSNILHERPVEAGVDPSFEIADPNVTAPLLLEEAWRDWLGRQIGGTCEPLRDGLLAGLSLETFRTLATQLTAQRALATTATPDASFSQDAWIAAIDREADDVLAFADSHCQNPKDTLYKRTRDFVEAIAATRALPSEERALELAGIADRIAKGTQKNWNAPDHPPQVIERLERLAALLPAVNHPIAAAAYRWLLGFLERYTRLKRERGLLDFDDLLILTRDLLRDNKPVRRDFQRRFQCLLIDEFQDTDPLQSEILWFLAEAQPQANDWRQVKIQPGKLFVVGDPKQSIYRFRHADIEVYETARESFAPEEILRLYTNFRSAPPIIDYVNATFEQLIRPPEDGRYQPEYVPLAPFRAKDANSRIIYLQASPDDGPPEKGNLEDHRRFEAELIARWLRQTIEEGALQVYDRTRKQTRPIEPRDIAILFRRFSNVALYEDALRRTGLDYYVLGGKSFYQAPEVRTLIHLLRATALPHNKVEFVAALRSMAFACSDEQLFLCNERHGLDWPRLAHLDPAALDSRVAPVVRAARHLAAWAEASGALAPSAAIERILADVRLEVWCGVQPGGARQLANLRKAVGLVRELETREVLTLRGAAGYLAGQQGLEVDESEPPVVEEADNVVRLLTIHKAKGLEFPLVILADLMSGGERHDSVNTLFDRDRQRAEVALRKDVRTAGYAALAEREALRVHAEEVRLLYVAATRARDHLAIPWGCARGTLPELFIEAGMAPPEDDDNAVVRVGRDSAIEASLVRAATLPPLPPEPAHFRQALLAAAESKPDARARQALAEREQWLERRRALAAPETISRKIVSPSALAHDAHEPLRTEEDAPATAPPHGDGRAIGTAVHRALERLELPDGGNRAHLIAEISNELMLSAAEKKRFVELLENTIAAPDFARIANAAEIHREVPFCVQTDEGLLEGFIDCLYRDDNGWWIVDYKTDRIPPAGPAALIEHYRPQCAAYAKAIERITNAPPAGCHLFLLAADPPTLARVF